MRIALSATLLTALLVVPLAYFMARRKFLGKTLIETLILVPLVLPPTVVGYLILAAVGARYAFGRWLEAHGITFIFDVKGAILAAAVVALPILYIPVKASFASIEREMEDVAKLMGANRFQTFWYISIPLARRGLASGLILAFARAIGEFGATVMVFGWHARQVTLPISIFADWEAGETPKATLTVIVLLVISFTLVLIYNLSGTGKREM